MKNLHRICCVAFILVLAARVPGQETTSTGPSRFALSLDAGTTGFGGSLWITVSPAVTVSLGYAALDYDDDYSTDEADYTGTAELANGHALLNWHPFYGSFHLSGGAMLADNKVFATGAPRAGAVYEFNGVEYPANLVGTLTANADISDGTVPYLGLGWSTSPSRQGFGFFLQAGVMFSGSADVSLSANGPLASDPVFQENLQREEQDLQDELDKFKVFPVLKLGMVYRF